jgi:DNA polymerase-3 subunit epsilon
LYAIIDIETTGQALSIGKITDIAIFVHDGFKIIDSFTSLINPECYIPRFITNLTGIDNEMVKNAPKFYEVAKEIIEITQDKVFVAHNVSFDYKFVQAEFKQLGYDYQRKTMCTVRMGRKYLPGHRSYSLGNLCDELGISINDRHRAAGDALATVKLFEMIMDKKVQKDSKQNPGQLRLF